MSIKLFACLLFALAATLAAQESDHLPQIDGYVTRVASPTDFDVNGFRVLLTGKTKLSEEDRSRHLTKMNILVEPKPYLGAHAQIFGKLDLHKHTIKANEISFITEAAELKGSALIDGMPSPSGGQAVGKLIRADGYLILLDAKTAITFTPPLTALADVDSKVWITYEGTRRSDGVVVASSALLVTYQLTAAEEKVKEKFDYDPGAVNPDDKQNVASKVFFGLDVRKIPPYLDSAMQTKVTKIGESLVPKYQRQLSDSDPAKLHFRFQVVDQPGWKDAVVSPGGVIVISKQVVERLENDSQLAAVLADSIAGQLEKGAYQELSLKHKAEIGTLVSATPYGAVASMVISKQVATAERRIQDQATRVSLWLMKDAGYSLPEAPKAWWILSMKTSKPLAEVTLSERVASSYEAIGTIWRGGQLSGN